MGFLTVRLYICNNHVYLSLFGTQLLSKAIKSGCSASTWGCLCVWASASSAKNKFHLSLNFSYVFSRCVVGTADKSVELS